MMLLCIDHYIVIVPSEKLNDREKTKRDGIAPPTFGS